MEKEDGQLAEPRDSGRWNEGDREREREREIGRGIRERWVRERDGDRETRKEHQG